jgi:hypothetical protein
VDGNRYVVSDRAVWPDLVVVSAPMLQLFTGVGKGQEPVGVQAFGPEFAVERLDEGIVSGLAGSGEVEGEPRPIYWRPST